MTDDCISVLAGHLRNLQHLDLRGCKQVINQSLVFESLSESLTRRSILKKEKKKIIELEIIIDWNNNI